MSIHRAVLIHVFNGKEKAVHIGPHPCPKTTGSKLGAFLRSISDAQIEGMIEKLEGLEWADEYDQIPKHLQDRYFACGIFGVIDCVSPSTHDSPSKHWWMCMQSYLSAIDALPHILDGSLTHVVDDTREFDKGDLEYQWEYRVDWDRRVVHVVGPMPGKMSAVFEKMDAQWMAGCQSANKVFA